MLYCISDIHGNYAKYQTMLQEINFTEQDTLYVLGDVVDRGPQPMRILLDMMARSNVIPLAGNHDVVAACCLRALSHGITDEALDSLDENTVRLILAWMADGGETTLKDFRRLSPEQQEDILAYLDGFRLFAEVWAGESNYVLVHAGLEHFSPERQLTDYSEDEVTFCRTNYSKPLFQDKYLITGHTPTALIPGNPNPGYIYRANNHIAIDCGCAYGGALGAFCLDTGEEFYV